ncbi:low temperature requirement protein A [Actinophytocola oryzae]|uniref:Low temperature requirement protein LtrA n=1 Tax=Actinophytocola oryzae TaxID=502181 RepID=A0A4R7V5P5_9PSEU|nr:low temperature requirement protein A [Actinophytocola oryzae]TDV44270.1 low temperature requirement protein LtrA [Actinophytocola oryzae]
MSEPRVAAAPAERVRTLELFFDLVFVFTITQVAAVLTAAPDGTGLFRTVVLLGLVWWMYGGYAWLTNSLDLERTGPRLLLLTGMAAYFVMSLAVPRFFDDGPFGLVMGLAYLVVVVVHAVGFLGTSGRAGIARIGPVNVLGALLVVTAGIVPPDARVWVLLGAVAVAWSSPALVGIGGFAVGAGHFVERHGLALIILLGESIIAVGTAASHDGHVLTMIAGPLLALAVSASLWWLYFDREERDSEALLDEMPPDRRGRAALASFGHSYLVIIAGVTVAAVGMKKAVTYLDEPLHGLALWLMPLGVAGCLVGLALFHRALTPSWPWRRLVAAAAVLLCVPAGLVGGWLMLAVAVVVLGALIGGERGRG